MDLTSAPTITHPLLKELLRVDLDLTGLCNRQCSFCPRSLDAEPLYPNINKQISLETIEIIIAELQSINFQGWVELAGRGESTLHKKFSQIVDMLTSGNRQWKVRLTTNGYKIDEWWDTVGNKLDQLILNNYESKEEHDERVLKYPKLPNGNIVRHYYKQDGYSIKHINEMPSYKEDGKNWKHAFNNRAGYFKGEYSTIPEEVKNSACWHPVRQIFIDFDGNYQMCCNDWLNQIKIGNIHERSLIDMYLNDPKVNRIRWQLLNKNRHNILPCAKCDDVQGSTKSVVIAIERFKQSSVYRRHVVPLAERGKHFDEDLKKGV